MSSHSRVVAPRRTSTGARLGEPRGTGLQTDVIRAELLQARRRLVQRIHEMRYRPPRRTPARMLVLIPAHDDEATIGRTLEALLTQSRVPDRIVLLADDCTDRTEEIARRFRGVTVMRTVDNTERKVGALNQGWRRWQAGYDVIAGIDADTILAPDCLQQLEDELAQTIRPGGVVARYTYDQSLGSTAMARMLLRMKRPESTSWTMDVLEQDRKTYVLGGQASLFSAEALRRVAELNQTPGPWDATAQVEDMRLTGDLRGMDYQTLVSTTARAHAGPMLTMRSLWAQRRAWDEGMAHLLARPSLTTWTLWKQQLSLLSHGVSRLLFLVLLTASLTAHQLVWSWIWLTPPIVASILHAQLALRVPEHTVGDVLAGALLIPVEIYLWMRLACTTAAWSSVLAGIRRESGGQARVQPGGSRRPGVAIAWTGLAVVVTAVVLGWLNSGAVFQARVLTVGWGVLAIIAAAQAASMVLRILRPGRGLEP